MLCVTDHEDFDIDEYLTTFHRWNRGYSSLPHWLYHRVVYKDQILQMANKRETS